MHRVLLLPALTVVLTTGVLPAQDNSAGNIFNSPVNNTNNGPVTPNANGSNNPFGSPTPNDANPSVGAAQVVLKFNGTGAGVTSPIFTVQDKWEVFWTCPNPVNLTIVGADGTAVTGVRARGNNAIYQGKGGTYYLQVEAATGFHPSPDLPGTSALPWSFVIGQVANGATLPAADTSPEMAEGGRFGYTLPGSIRPPGNNSGAAAAPNPFGQGAPPVSDAPQPAAAPMGKLTDDQARAVVLIKGDHAEGTGFLIKTPDGPAIVTNIHVIANNPNLKITTNTGAFVKMISAKAASDRDLALLAIHDAGYGYLEVSTDISHNVQPGDEVITPGNSQGGEVMLNTTGKVLGIGPERIEFDNPIYHGNSGGPVFHTKSGKVLGVVTEAMKVDTTNALDKASFASRNSAISGTMRYFGLRLDTVSLWIPIDSRRFQIETTFLDQFHEQSRRIDAFLNQVDRNSDDGRNSRNSNAAAKIYLNDEKIVKAIHNYTDHATDADAGQVTEAKRVLLFDLQAIADQNVMQIQNAANFYSFDQERAREELAYRKALKAEMDDFSSNVERMPREY